MNPTTSIGTLRRTRRDYWEGKRDELIASLEERIARKSDVVPLRTILAQDLPEILKVTFRNHARYLVQKENPIVLQTVRQYELEDHDLRRQFHLLRDLLSERLVFDRSEIRPILTRGIRLQFDVLVMPRKALTRLFYSNAEEQAPRDLLVILEGLGVQTRYVELLLNKLREYSQDTVTRSAFSEVCGQIERELYWNHILPTLVADLAAFQEFRNSLLHTDSSAEPDSHAGEIENQTILAMLNERHLAQLAEALLPEVTQKESWPIAEIKDLLERCISNSGIQTGGEKAGSVSALPALDMNDFLEEAVSEIESHLVGAEMRKMMSPETRTRSSGETEPAGEKLGVGSGVRAPESRGATEGEKPDGTQQTGSRIWFDLDDDNRLIYRKKIEAQPAGPFPSLRTLIDDKNRKAFIRKLFQRDADAYLDFIERLEAIQTWKQAKFLLDTELAKRKVNPYSREAVRFSDLLFGRYFANG